MLIALAYDAERFEPAILALVALMTRLRVDPRDQQFTAAFLAFSRTPADACIVEVGLGGRLDATNVIPAPAACGIAQLGVDHVQFLGYRIEQMGWLEGYAGTVAYQLRGAAQNLPLSPRRYGGGLVAWLCVPVLFVAKVAFALLSSLLYWLDMRHKYTGAGYPKNYYVIATRT